MQIFLYLLSTMTHTFYKYQGTGNDFIIIDNRQGLFDKKDAKSIATLCDRRFGIGADGLILLEDHDTANFTMVYYNADGNESSMCGNGGRCITHFANFLGIIEQEATFMAIDGLHHAIIEGSEVQLQMKNVEEIDVDGDVVITDTGSPHFVTMMTNIAGLDVPTKGAEIRYSDTYKQEGINVNFVEDTGNNVFAVRTYERGVEDETLSCGTGVTAVALAMHQLNRTNKNEVHLKTQGGMLKVHFEPHSEGYSNIWLVGPATQVYKGEIEW